MAINLEQFRSDVIHGGWFRSVFKRLMSKLQKYAGLYLCWVFERPMQPNPVERSDGIDLRILSEGEALQAAEDPELEMSVEFVRTALARGDIAFGAFDASRLVSYTWRAFGPVLHDDGVCVRFDPPRHYGYKALTLPAYRGRGVQRDVARFSDDALYKRGCVAQLMFIEVGNFASLRTQRKLNARRIGMAGFIKRFGLFVSFRTPGVKKTGFRFAKEG